VPGVGIWQGGRPISGFHAAGGGAGPFRSHYFSDQ
jgi:hypothetical protein